MLTKKVELSKGAAGKAYLPPSCWLFQFGGKCDVIIQKPLHPTMWHRMCLSVSQAGRAEEGASEQARRGLSGQPQECVLAELNGNYA